ncbi:hypothetical protein [Chitinophaga filiformis]|uniref:Uncharacterized protein n=1 Tax=Chitinophaga filiformis TaxID=104663 RepID=A0A1G7M071_CHIFI|nr:hypothetical protein [Chitinophaga filiformis]SDF55051.1 hypothetical protein SAMN04488121_102243 [Chitinophaga filiformis]
MSGISHAITMALEAVINRATKKRVEANWEGRYILRMQKAYSILGWVCGMIACTPIVVLFFEVPSDISGWIALGFLFFSMGFAAALCILYYRNHQVAFDKTYIEVTSPLRKVTTSTWDKVVRTKYSYNAGLLTLIDSDGQKLKINHHLIGLSTFVSMLESKTGHRTGLGINRQ